MSPRRLASRVALVAALVLAACRPGGDEDGATGERPGAAPPAAGDQEVVLLFPAEGGEQGGVLRGERRRLDLPADRGDRGRAVLGALLAGPGTAGYARPLPEGTTVESVFVDPASIAYVDLHSAEPAPPSTGSRLELLAVYSLVDTLLGSDPSLRGVVLLWNGQQRPTFGGHVDTGRPLVFDRALVADPREAP